MSYYWLKNKQEGINKMEGIYILIREARHKAQKIRSVSASQTKAAAEAIIDLLDRIVEKIEELEK